MGENRSSAPMQAFLTLHDRDGEERGEYAMTVPAESVHQINDVFSTFPAGALDGASLRVVTDRDAYVYASIVRSDSDDATFVTATDQSRIDTEDFLEAKDPFACAKH